MAKHSNLTSLFTDIANAIRGKTGSTDPIVADDFPAAIEGIPAGGNTGGGGSGAVVAKDVNFYDYDGTLLHSYTVEEAQALTELPALPTQPGLICQGWNYDLETIKSYNRAVDVGATYITDDGTTRVYIHLEEGRTSPMLGVCPKGTVTVDWGDGTTPDVLTGTSITTVVWTPTHNYAKPGDYVITLTVDGQMGFAGDSSTKGGAKILRYGSSSDGRNLAYTNAIRKVEIGSAVTSIGTYAFQECHSLTSITIPDGVTSISSSAFQSCYSLASISIPDGVTSIDSAAFYYCYSLASITIPDGVTSISNSAFKNCRSLASITIPESVTSIGTYAFQECHSLASITIPESVTSIGTYAFHYCYPLTSITIPDGVTSISNSAFQSCYSLASISIPDGVTSIDIAAFSNCYGISYYDFTNHTAVPTLANTNAFKNIATDCEIRVPAALADEWKAATNWATYASQIVGV